MSLNINRVRGIVYGCNFNSTVLKEKTSDSIHRSLLHYSSVGSESTSDLRQEFPSL